MCVSGTGCNRQSETGESSVPSQAEITDIVTPVPGEEDNTGTTGRVRTVEGL